MKNYHCFLSLVFFLKKNPKLSEKNNCTIKYLFFILEKQINVSNDENVSLKKLCLLQTRRFILVRKTSVMYVKEKNKQIFFQQNN